MTTSKAHKEASKEYYRIAKEIESKMEAEKDENNKTGLRMVAGQNYFYAGVEAIEGVLKENGISIADHQDRIRKIEQNYRLFKNADMLLLKHKLLTQEGLNYRRAVAYRGENGKKFLTVKDFADTSLKELSINTMETKNETNNSAQQASGEHKSIAKKG